MKTNRWNWKRRSDRAGESGQAMLFVMLILGVFLLGALCFAFDLSNMWFHRQAAQTAADASCAAGAMDILVDAQGSPSGKQGFTLGTNYSCTTASTDSICSYAAKNGYNSNSTSPGNVVSVSFPTTAANGAPPGVKIPPSSVAGSYPFVRVDIVDHVQTFFAGLLNGGTTSDVRAFSTCGVELATAQIPLVILDPTDTKTLSGNGTPTIKILGGPSQSIQVNSSDLTASQAVAWGGTIDLSQGGPSYNGSSLGTHGGPATYSAGVGTFLPANSSDWLFPSSPINDPFAKINAPTQPTAGGVNDCTTTPANGGTCFPHDVPAGQKGCPETVLPCTEFSAGYYPGGICLGSSCPGGKNSPFFPYSPKNTAIFDPGVYYLDGGMALQDGSLVRPSTAAGDGSGGTMFYLTSDKTYPAQKCSGQTGLVCVGSNSGKGTGLTTFDITAAQCPGGAAVDPGLITALKADGVAYTGLTGNLLVAPCTGTYGDPTGAGQYRGMLLFGDRSSNVGGGWGGGGGFLLAGSIYFHQCNALGTGVSCGLPPADYQANFQFQGNSGTTSYVLGEIITDQLSGGGTPNIYMALNANITYNILKASIFQ
jgi:Putative Flp pilus-assembly TadE/G-like